MAIRGRVGRHTQAGGRQCQNWADDQRAVIDLLNRIPATNGGTGGRLDPRVVAGIAGGELYNAIVAFEDRHFPRQRSGFVDPGGRMYQKLEALASAAAAPPASAAPPPRPTVPPPPPPPPPLPNKRRITSGETALLRSVFRDTLPYWDLEVAVNADNVGGVDNSITPGYTPFFSNRIWCADFSDGAVDGTDKGTFIHEFVHAWQYYHENMKLSALWLFIRHLGDYEKAYPYDLSENDDLTDFNIEQQASIIEDWWRITQRMLPLNNVGAERRTSTYERFVDQLRRAGPPRTPAFVRYVLDSPTWGGGT